MKCAIEPGARRLGNILIARHVPSDVVLHVRTVGDVIVDVKVGIPGIENVQPGAHLGGVRLNVIAIQIDALRGVARARVAGAVLLRGD